MKRLLRTLKRAAEDPLLFARNLRPYDYVAPGLEPPPALLANCFPAVIHRKSFNPNVPHTARIDARFPDVGLVTWDEASIIYSYGRMLRGKRFLEIGCWVGWSTVILGLSGVELTVIDPVLGGEPQGDACRVSIARAGLTGSVRLVPGCSPEAVAKLSSAGERWDGFFIDGDHVGDAPLRDAMVCAEVAGPNSIMLFHDLRLHNIGQALTWLEGHGWNCAAHYTSMFLGVAWRGTCTPLRHKHDPLVKWHKLVANSAPHLKGLLVL